MVDCRKSTAHWKLAAVLICLSSFSTPAPALDAYDFAGLVGFTVVASSRVKGDYYGAEPGKPILLDNGMSFTFSVRFSTYSYRPVAVVFARLEAESGQPAPNASFAANAYKVLVQDRIYDASRLR